MMKRLLSLFALIVAAVAAGAQTADRLMADAAAKFAAAGSVDIAFTTTADNGPVAGTLSMQQRAYTLTSAPMSIWYDGNTQWVYVPSNQEISITTPTPEELLESNPFMLISSYRKLYKLTKGSGRTVILTPKSPSQSSLRQASITFAADGWPSKIDAVFDSGARLQVNIGKITTGKAKALTAYRLDPKRYPAAELIDLR